jgi:hypothetical protein
VKSNIGGMEGTLYFNLLRFSLDTTAFLICYYLNTTKICICNYCYELGCFPFNLQKTEETLLSVMINCNTDCVKHLLRTVRLYIVTHVVNCTVLCTVVPP